MRNTLIRILSYLIKKLSKQEIVGIKKIAGHTFKLLDPTTAPIVRQNQYNSGNYDMHWGMTKEDLLKHDNKILSLLSPPTSFKNNSDYLEQMNNKLEAARLAIRSKMDHLKNDFAYEPFLKSASHIIIMDNEDPNKIDPKIYQEKINLCKENDEVMFFFLNHIMSIHARMLGLSSTWKTQVLQKSGEIRSMENKVLGSIGKKI